MIECKPIERDEDILKGRREILMFLQLEDWEAVRIRIGRHGLPVVKVGGRLEMSKQKYYAWRDGLRPSKKPVKENMPMGKDQLEIFRYHGNSVRVIQGPDGEPWFVAKDVTDILGYANGSRDIQRHCKYAKTWNSTETVVLTDSPRGTLVIPESDLYRLIMKSGMAEAERFQSWVTEEVLPSIRKHGAYMTPETIEKVLADPDTIIKLATSLKEERVRRKALEEEKRMLTPKAEQYDRFMNGSNYKTMEAVAKVLGMGKIRLFRCLRERKVVAYPPILRTRYHRNCGRSFRVLARLPTCVRALNSLIKIYWVSTLAARGLLFWSASLALFAGYDSFYLIPQ